MVSDPVQALALWKIREDGAGLAGVSLARPAYSGWEDAAVRRSQPAAYRSVYNFAQELRRMGEPSFESLRKPVLTQSRSRRKDGQTQAKAGSSRLAEDREVTHRRSAGQLSKPLQI